jgi:LysM repeat protein
MSKRIAITLLAVLVLSVSACTRAASTALPATATAVSNFPAVPAAATSMKVIEDAGTQTAIAQTGTPQGGQPAVSTPSLATITPQPGATQGPTPTVGTIVNTPAPGVTVVATTVLTKPATYALHAGEFPYCIARRYNVDPGELLALNGLSQGQQFFDPGTVLKIPTSGKAFPADRSIINHPATHTVLSGETIYSIACKFGDVDPQGIINQNNLQSPYNLTVGSQITIP